MSVTLTPYQIATRTSVLATEAEAILKATRHRRTTDRRALLNISLNLAVAIENLRECSGRLRHLGTPKKASR